MAFDWTIVGRYMTHFDRERLFKSVRVLDQEIRLMIECFKCINMIDLMKGTKKFL